MNPVDLAMPLTSDLSADQPWPGLAAFGEGDREYFHGRGQESAELLRLVQREALTVLFGKSGLGKTSLLQAGLFPALRSREFLPVYVRLDHGAQAPALRQQILDELARACAQWQVQPAIVQQGESLWAFFHRRNAVFWSRQNRPLQVVLVLDQFEEWFTLGQETDSTRARLAEFLPELAALVENRPPPDIKAVLEQDPDAADAYEFRNAGIRLVFSFREDYLPDMEGLKRSMPSLMYNRLRLLPMDGAQAYAVVRNSGADLVDDAVARCILRLAWENKPEPGVPDEDFADLKIEPALLSVVCTELNRKRFDTEPPAPHIGMALLAGADQEILSGFYARSLHGLAEGQAEKARVFVEEELLTSRGFRASRDSQDAQDRHGLSQATIDQLIARRLLRKDERQGQHLLELTHDVLTQVVRTSRDARRAQEAQVALAVREQAARALESKNRRDKLRNRVSLVVIVLLLSWAVWRGDQLQQIIAKNEKAEQRAVAARLAATSSEAEALRQQGRAKQALEEARAAREAALAAQTVALAADDKAKVQTRLAEQAKVVAGTAKAQALVAQATAKTALAAADAAKVQAQAAGANARQQENRANQLFAQAQSVRLMATADRLPEYQFERGLLLNLAALKTAPTIDAHAGLLRRFHRHPHLAEIVLDEDQNINHLASSPDGKILAFSRYGEKSISLWDVANRRVLAQLLEHKKAITALAFSADGKRLASGDDDGKIIIWDGATYQPLRHIPAHKGYVRKVAFSANHARLAAYGKDRVITIWDAASGNALAKPISHGKGIADFALSPDGARVAWLDSTGTIRLWDVAQGTLQATLPFGSVAYGNLVFSPDGLRLAASNKQQVLVWNIAQAKSQPVMLQLADSVSGLAFDNTGKLLAAGNFAGGVSIWDIAKGKSTQQLTGHSAGIEYLAFTADGQSLVSWGGNVIRWHLSQRNAQTMLRGPQTGIADFAYSPDSQVLATSSRQPDHALMLWPLAGSGAPRLLVREADGIRSVAFSPDGIWLAWASERNKVVLWHRLRQHVVVELTAAPESLIQIIFSPDSKKVAAMSGKGEILLWDITAPHVPQRLQERPGLPPIVLGNSLMAFSPDGKHLVAPGWDQTVLWNISHTPATAQTLPDSVPSTVTAFSPNGQLLATTDFFRYSVILLDTVQHKPQATLFGQTAWITKLAFSPDGQWLGTTSIDGTAILWDVANRSPVATLHGDKAELINLAFRPDGKQLATSDDKGQITLWQFDRTELTAQACRIVSRNLTCDEWQQYGGPNTPYQKVCPALPGPKQCTPTPITPGRLPQPTPQPATK